MTASPFARATVAIRFDPRPHLRPSQLAPAHHPEQRRADEYLERHEYADRVARQPEVRLARDLAEALRHPRLHRDSVKSPLATVLEGRLHDVALADRDATRRNERVGLHEVVEDRLAELLRVVRHDPGRNGDRAGLSELPVDRVGIRVADLAELLLPRGLNPLLAGG